jgi:hypothetical protein
VEWPWFCPRGGHVFASRTASFQGEIGQIPYDSQITQLTKMEETILGIAVINESSLRSMLTFRRSCHFYAAVEPGLVADLGPGQRHADVCSEIDQASIWHMAGVVPRRQRNEETKAG